MLDSEIALMSNRHREYSPQFGRFLQADPTRPIVEMGLYAYSMNNPTNLGDPSGLHAEIPTWLQSKARVPAPTGPDGEPLPPPVPLPAGKNGEPNEWVPATPSGQGDRDAKWKPQYPVPHPKGSQPGASWDPDGHWDIDWGNPKDRQRVDENGNPVIHQCTPAPPRPDLGSPPPWLPLFPLFFLPLIPILLL
jgi:RHS repeat-associated protein